MEPLISLPLQIIIYTVLAVSMLALLYRVAVGPHVLDRIMVLDFLALILISMVGAWGLVIGSSDFFDVILVLTIIGFITTVALAKFVEAGKVVE
jgi:multisubunit Na+/H+ antiporter MnhF subunit